MTVRILIAMLATRVFVQGAGFSERDLAFSVCSLGTVPGELPGRGPVGVSVPTSPEWACAVDHESINWLTHVRAHVCGFAAGAALVTLFENEPRRASPAGILGMGNAGRVSTDFPPLRRPQMECAPRFALACRRTVSWLQA